MARPTPEAISAIRDRVTDWTPNDQQIADELNLADQPNPTPQPQVPMPFESRDLALACSEANRPKLQGLLAGSAAPLILARDRVHLGQGLDGLEAIGTFSAADVAAMKAVLSETIPDPNWQPLVSWAQLNLGRPADADDVAAARPGA